MHKTSLAFFTWSRKFLIQLLLIPQRLLLTPIVFVGCSIYTKKTHIKDLNIL